MDFSPIDFKSDLNEEQYAAVSASPGPSLVLAGAGSGKTRTLTYRVAWLLLEEGLSPDNLLLLTFTNKAAREMIERVKELAGIHRAPRWSGTFHSIGGRLLRIHGHHLGLGKNYTILDQSDAESLITRVIKEEDKLFLKNKDNPKAKVILNLISYGRNTCEELRELVKARYPFDPHIARKILGFANVYQATKLEEQVTDYDDLLVYWRRLLDEVEDVRQRCESMFPSILVDEYQDTNTLQAAIIDQIGRHHNIMAVGDDAQCIYTWRGANFENIRSFPERHPGCRFFKIVTNYRSSPQILNFANAVLAAQPADSGYAKELQAACPNGEIPFVVPLMDTQRQADFLALRVQALFEEGYALKDIAILYRAHYQALDVQLEFTRRGIPFVITSGVQFFEQAHIRDFVAQLRVLNNPKDYAAFERVLTLLPKVGPATVGKIFRQAVKALETIGKNRKQEEDPLFDSTPSEAPHFVEALGDPSVVAKVPADAKEDYIQLAATFKELFESLREEPGPSPEDLVSHALQGWYGDYIRNVYPDWETRRDDLQSLVQFASRYDTMNELLAQLVLMSSETSNRSIQPEDEAIRMTTIHQAKGLEYPIVFVIGCAEDLFPLRRAVENGDTEEERRLFYVAVTRAKEALYLCFPMVSSGRGNVQRLLPSRFLQEVPRDRYEKLHVTHNW